MPISAVPADRPEPLRLRGIVVDHRQKGAAPFRALTIAALDVAAAARVGFAGPSGAGKSTLLHLVAGLLRPTEGSVSWGGERLDRLGESDRDRWRRQTIGFVFQDFHLVDELSVVDNVLMPARFDRFRLPADLRRRALDLVERVGLADPNRRAAKLSRGERQRVAVARALLLSPQLILADEPTASLDAEAGGAVRDLLIDAARETAATLLVVAHDEALLARLDRVHRLKAGRLVEEEPA